MPAHHDVRRSDVLSPRLHANLAAAADRGPADFAELLLIAGVGARTVRALAMVAEVVHGAPYRFTDPARFSFAHGGKDRHPFPVPLRVYDQTIQVLKSAVQSAKLGREEELAALFMPFAPVVAEEKAADIFDVKSVNARACRYMTITCDVRPAWRARIPAVVHVDHSARPQTIVRSTNPLYYDILASFERVSGIPVLVNTSFNVHEEPIVNTPSECMRALVDGRIDFVATDRALYERAS